MHADFVTASMVRHLGMAPPSPWLRASEDAISVTWAVFSPEGQSGEGSAAKLIRGLAELTSSQLSGCGPSSWLAVGGRLCFGHGGHPDALPCGPAWSLSAWHLLLQDRRRL